MDPDPAIFVIDLQDANKKKNLKKSFCLLPTYFLKVHLHHFSKIKKNKSQNSRNQDFYYYLSIFA
jgi:hypothetical protein